ncbi:MAG: GNAT family N-acetyltransferase [Thermotogae bacterium]|nr:GNAT family N-acetyltransferase [Thermotogota bacterium]
MFKLLFGLWLLEYKSKPGGCYIEHIAVRPAFQGRGIGTSCLSSGRSSPAKSGFERAVQLYREMGFRTMGVTRSLITRHLFGVSEWHYMDKYLKPRT